MSSKFRISVRYPTCGCLMVTLIMLLLFSAEAQQPRLQLSTYHQNAWPMKMDANAEYLVTGGFNEVIIWDVRSNLPLHFHELTGFQVMTDLQVSELEPYVYITTLDATYKFDIRLGIVIEELPSGAWYGADGYDVFLDPEEGLLQIMGSTDTLNLHTPHLNIAAVDCTDDECMIAFPWGGILWMDMASGDIKGQANVGDLIDARLWQGQAAVLHCGNTELVLYDKTGDTTQVIPLLSEAVFAHEASDDESYYDCADDVLQSSWMESILLDKDDPTTAAEMPMVRSGGRYILDHPEEDKLYVLTGKGHVVDVDLSEGSYSSVWSLTDARITGMAAHGQRPHNFYVHTVDEASHRQFALMDIRNQRTVKQLSKDAASNNDIYTNSMSDYLFETGWRSLYRYHGLDKKLLHRYKRLDYLTSEYDLENLLFSFLHFVDGDLYFDCIDIRYNNSMLEEPVNLTSKIGVQVLTGFDFDVLHETFLVSTPTELFVFSWDGQLIRKIPHGDSEAAFVMGLPWVKYTTPNRTELFNYRDGALVFAADGSLATSGVSGLVASPLSAIADPDDYWMDLETYYKQVVVFHTLEGMPEPYDTIALDLGHVQSNMNDNGNLIAIQTSSLAQVDSSNENAIVIWDMVNGEHVGRWPIDGFVYHMEFMDESSKLAVYYSNFMTVYDIAKSEAIMSYRLTDRDMIYLKSPYYHCDRGSLDELVYTFGGKAMPAYYFDHLYNRPDQILKAMDSVTFATEIRGLEQAFDKRMQIGDFTAELPDPDELPRVEVTNWEAIEFETFDSTLDMEVEASDERGLSALHILVNGVPIYGMNGIALDGEQAMTRRFNDIGLMPSINEFEIYAVNEAGAQSLIESFEVNFLDVNYLDPDYEEAYYYVGLGISKYRDSTKNLQLAAKDVRDISAMLANTKQRVTIDTLLNEDVTLENFRKIKERLMKTHTSDRVILSLSGHGLLDSLSNFYFATYDTDFDNPAAKAISYEMIEWLLDSIPARMKVVLMDACHSGEVDPEAWAETDFNLSANVSAVPPGGKGVISLTRKANHGMANSFKLMQEIFADLSRGNGAIVVSAAGGLEFAFEDERWRNGVFTYSVLRALDELEADYSGDGKVTISELKRFVTSEVVSLTNGRQRPTSRQENIGFDFVVW